MGAGQSAGYDETDADVYNRPYPRHIIAIPTYLPQSFANVKPCVDLGGPQHTHTPYTGDFILTPQSNKIAKSLSNDELCSLYTTKYLKKNTLIYNCEIAAGIEGHSVCSRSFENYVFIPQKHTFSTLDYPGCDLVHHRDDNINLEQTDITYLSLALPSQSEPFEYDTKLTNQYRFPLEVDWRTVNYQGSFASNAFIQQYSGKPKQSISRCEYSYAHVRGNNHHTVVLPKLFPLRMGLMNESDISPIGLIHVTPLTLNELSRHCSINYPGLAPIQFGCISITIPADLSNLEPLLNAKRDICDFLLNGTTWPLLSLNIHIFLQSKSMSEDDLANNDVLKGYFTEIGYGDEQIFIHSVGVSESFLASKCAFTVDFSTGDLFRTYLQEELDLSPAHAKAREAAAQPLELITTDSATKSKVMWDEIFRTWFRIQGQKARWVALKNHMQHHQDDARPSKRSATATSATLTQFNQLTQLQTLYPPQYQMVPAPSQLLQLYRSLLFEWEKTEFDTVFQQREDFYKLDLESTCLGIINASGSAQYYQHPSNDTINRYLSVLSEASGVFRMGRSLPTVFDFKTIYHLQSWIFSRVRPELPLLTFRDVNCEVVLDDVRGVLIKTDPTMNDSIHVNTTTTTTTTPDGNNNNTNNNNNNNNDVDQNALLLQFTPTRSQSEYLATSPEIAQFDFNAFIINRYFPTSLTNEPSQQAQFLKPVQPIINRLNQQGAKSNTAIKPITTFGSRVLSVFPRPRTAIKRIDYELVARKNQQYYKSNQFLVNQFDFPPYPLARTDQPRLTPQLLQNFSITQRMAMVTVVERGFGDDRKAGASVIVNRAQYDPQSDEAQSRLKKSLLVPLVSPVQSNINYLYRNDSIMGPHRIERPVHASLRLQRPEDYENTLKSNGSINLTVFTKPMEYLYGVHLMRYDPDFGVDVDQMMAMMKTDLDEKRAVGKKMGLPEDSNDDITRCEAMYKSFKADSKEWDSLKANLTIPALDPALLRKQFQHLKNVDFRHVNLGLEKELKLKEFNDKSISKERQLLQSRSLNSIVPHNYLYRMTSIIHDHNEVHVNAHLVCTPIHIIFVIPPQTQSPGHTLSAREDHPFAKLFFVPPKSAEVRAQPKELNEPHEPYELLKMGINDDGNQDYSEETRPRSGIPIPDQLTGVVGADGASYENSACAAKYGAPPIPSRLNPSQPSPQCLNPQPPPPSSPVDPASAQFTPLEPTVAATVQKYRDQFDYACKVQAHHIFKNRLVDNHNLDYFWYFHIVPHEHLSQLMAELQYNAVQQRLQMYSKVLE